VYLIGLTGGIASGKTTVAKRLVELGAVEIDADVLARQAVERGSAGLAQIQDRWGSSLVTEEGELDRAALAKIVFADPEERHHLESIVHPIVRKLARDALEHQTADAIVVYTVPLLVEAKVDLPFDLVVTVEAPETQQIERMIKHRGMTADEALARIGNQATAAQRANHANIILNSNQSLGRLIDDVDNLWAEIVSRSAAKQGS